MFKSATLYHLRSGFPFDVATLEDCLAKRSFVACGATQEISCGWWPARDIPFGALVESVAGHLVMRLRIEKKSVPSALIARHLEERCKAVEQATGRKPGKKQQKEMKEEIKQELLPQAFPKQDDVLVWVDRQNSRLVLDSSSNSKSDVVTTAIVQTLDTLVIAPMNLKRSTAGEMTTWLQTGETPSGISIDRECELEGTEDKPKVSYSRLSVDVAEVRSQLQQGLLPKSVGLTWDGALSFVLTNALVLKKIKLLGIKDPAKDQDPDLWEGSLALLTSQLTQLVDTLIEAHDGIDEHAASQEREACGDDQSHSDTHADAGVGTLVEA